MSFTYETLYLLWYIMRVFINLLADASGGNIAIGRIEGKGVDILREWLVLCLSQKIGQVVGIGPSPWSYQ